MDTNIGSFDLICKLKLDKMKNQVNERIRKLMKNENLSQKKFCEILEISWGTLNTTFKRDSNPGTEILIKISNKFPQYSINWLLTGIDGMLKNSDGIASEPRAADENTNLLKEIQELKKKIKKLESEIDNERSINAGRNELIETLRKTIEVLINK